MMPCAQNLIHLGRFALPVSHCDVKFERLSASRFADPDIPDQGRWTAKSIASARCAGLRCNCQSGNGARFAGILLLLPPAVVFRGLIPIPPGNHVVASLAALEYMFVMRTLGGALLFWIVLGTLSG